MSRPLPDGSCCSRVHEVSAILSSFTMMATPVKECGHAASCWVLKKIWKLGPRSALMQSWYAWVMCRVSVRTRQSIAAEAMRSWSRMVLCAKVVLLAARPHPAIFNVAITNPKDL